MKHPTTELFEQEARFRLSCNEAQTPELQGMLSDGIPWLNRHLLKNIYRTLTTTNPRLRATPTSKGHTVNLEN